MIGEDPAGVPNNLMPYVAQVAVGKLDKLRVFGSDYDTHDGTGVRDYIHVVDLARGHIAAIDALRSLDRSFVVNLGTGHGYSVLDVVKAFEAASGKRVPYELVPRRPGDVAACYADPAAAEKLSAGARNTASSACVPITGAGSRRTRKGSLKAAPSLASSIYDDARRLSSTGLLSCLVLRLLFWSRSS